MHIQKTGGSSVHQALERALPPGSISPWTFDRSVFCGGFEDFDELSEPARSLVATDDESISAMKTSPVVMGHFCFGTLTQLTEPSSIATLLREPRAQLLSLYAYWRLQTPEMLALWHPYRAASAAQQPLDDFLADESVAAAIDSPVCRALLYDRGLIDPRKFAPVTERAGLASAAIERLQTLGAVAVLELGETVWGELSRFFDADLTPTRANVTGEAVGGSAPPTRLDITPRTLELLEERTAVDAIIYEHTLALRGLDRGEIERLREAAFATQLTRLGNLLAGSAASALDSELDLLRDSCRLLSEDLARHRAWLAGMQRSASWRLTRPLRQLKRVLSRRRTA